MVAYQDFVALSRSGDSEERGRAAHLAAQAYLMHTGPADACSCEGGGPPRLTAR